MKNTTEEEREKKLSVVNEGNGYYTVTVSDIVGDTYIFIAGYYERQINVNYMVDVDYQPPTICRDYYIDMAVGTTDNIVWTQNVEYGGSVNDLRIPQSNKIYFRVRNNRDNTPYQLETKLDVILYLNGGETNMTKTVTNGEWFEAPYFEEWDRLNDIDITTYSLTLI